MSTDFTSSPAPGVPWPLQPPSGTAVTPLESSTRWLPSVSRPLGDAVSPAQRGPWGGEGPVHRPRLLLPAPARPGAALRPSAAILR